MRWMAAALAAVFVIGLGIWVAGPPIQDHRIRLPYAPVPSFIAPFTIERPTPPIPLPDGSYSALGGFELPYQPALSTGPGSGRWWVGKHSFLWPLSIHAAMRWAGRHIGGPWRPSGSGQTGGRGYVLYRWLAWSPRSHPNETLILQFAPRSPQQTWVTISFNGVIMPPRAPITQMPPNAQSVAVVYTGGRHGRERMVVTTRADVRRLVRIVNHASIAPQGPNDCEAQVPGIVNLRLRYRKRSAIVVQYTPACDWFQVGSNPQRFREGDLGNWVDRALHAAGLPLL